MSEKKSDLQPFQEFIEMYKSSDSETHFIKLFNKVGKEIIEPTEDDKWFNDLKLHIKCFFQEALKLNTVSFLFGTGSSICLGAESIATIPKAIDDTIARVGLKETHNKFLKCFSEDVDLETYLGSLIRLDRIYKRHYSDRDSRIIKLTRETTPKRLKALIEILKKGLYEICNIPNIQKIENEYYKKDPLRVHKELIKKVLARPINLERVKVFTTNYDLAFEKSMDELGVIYIDGFVGNVRRMFKPEVYNYDYYFPASTTEGIVHRLDKVLHLYKLHGSLNWVDTGQSFRNIYGVEQSSDGNFNNRLLIYPQPMKDEETLGFPYSEIFRRFSSVIQQPQNILIIYGYGFGDEHINRVIYNALTISTFQLVVVSWNWSQKLKAFYENVKDDSRVSFLVGNYLGDWKTWVFDLLPDIRSMELDENILETMKKLKGERSGGKHI